jgi:hypothetical protein
MIQNQVPACAIVEMTTGLNVAYPLIAWDELGVALLLTDKTRLVEATRVTGKLLGVHVGDWTLEGNDLEVAAARLLWRRTQEQAAHS